MGEGTVKGYRAPADQENFVIAAEKLGGPLAQSEVEAFAQEQWKMRGSPQGQNEEERLRDWRPAELLAAARRLAPLIQPLTKLK